MKRALWLAGIAIVVFLAVGVYEAGFYPSLSPKIAGNITFGNGTLYGRRLTNASWQASYDSISTNADQTILNLHGVHDGLIFKDGVPYLRVRAKTLTVNTQTHDFSATGGVHVDALRRETPVRSFDADDLTWSNALQRVSVTGKITIDSGAVEPLTIAGLTYDLRTGQLHLGAIDGAANVK